MSASMDERTCEHEWHCPGVLNMQTKQGSAVILPLYCARCAAVVMRIAPPPEVDEATRARAQIVQPVLVPPPGAFTRNR